MIVVKAIVGDTKQVNNKFIFLKLVISMGIGYFNSVYVNRNCIVVDFLLAQNKTNVVFKSNFHKPLKSIESTVLAGFTHKISLNKNNKNKPD